MGALIDALEIIIWPFQTSGGCPLCFFQQGVVTLLLLLIIRPLLAVGGALIVLFVFLSPVPLIIDDCCVFVRQEAFL